MSVITPEMGAIPSHWLAYFAVDDCDAMTQKSVNLGGSIMYEPTDIPGTGRFSILVDPQGAAFALIKPEPMQA